MHFLCKSIPEDNEHFFQLKITWENTTDVEVSIQIAIGRPDRCNLNLISRDCRCDEQCEKQMMTESSFEVIPPVVTSAGRKSI